MPSPAPAFRFVESRPADSLRKRMARAGNDGIHRENPASPKARIDLLDSGADISFLRAFLSEAPEADWIWKAQYSTRHSRLDIAS